MLKSIESIRWISCAAKNFKSYLPQRHRGHRERLFIVSDAYGVANKINLCALCASVVKAFDFVFELTKNVFSGGYVFNIYTLAIRKK